MYQKIPVLYFHSINNPYEFEKQILYLKKNNYQSIDLSEIDTLSEKKIIITFDDGYKDNYLTALPILKKHQFKATCFIVSNYIGKFNSWDLNRHDYLKKELMNKNDISEWLKNGMSIGSHTHNHLNLTTLSDKDLTTELNFSKKYLEDTFSIQIHDFCYPYGKVNSKVYQKIKEIYKFGVTTNRSRYIQAKHDHLLIPRIDLGKKFNKLKIYLKLKTLYEDIKFKKNEI